MWSGRKINYHTVHDVVRKIDQLPYCTRCGQVKKINYHTVQDVVRKIDQLTHCTRCGQVEKSTTSVYTIWSGRKINDNTGYNIWSARKDINISSATT